MKRLLKILGILLFIIIIIIILARYVGTNGFITKEYAFNDANMPQHFDGLKIVHFSDIHYKRAISNEKILDIVDEINLINPDIVIFTGDLVDNDSTLLDTDFDFLINSFNKINAKYGKYSVLGEHDYNSKEKILDLYMQSGFTYLENDYDIIEKDEKKIYIGGLGNVTYKENDISKLSNFNDIDFKIILVHEPDISMDIYNSISPSLILAGHSHNGQFRLPFIGGILKPKLGKKYYQVYYEFGTSRLFVSSGIGVSNLNYRFFNKPSINFYRINKENSN